MRYKGSDRDVTSENITIVFFFVNTLYLTDAFVCYNYLVKEI